MIANSVSRFLSDTALTDTADMHPETPAPATPATRYTVILVRPKYPRNIGMVSRAMCNYGHEQLILIDPQCELDQQARKGAAQGQGPLRACVTYDNWEDYARAEPDSIRIAFSRRSGKRRPSQPFSELITWPVLQDGRPISLIFGAEDHGLSREDLLWAHRTATLDIPGPLMSMNLSHAVLLALSVLPKTHQSPDETSAAAEVSTPDDILRAWLTRLDFDLSTKNWNAFYAIRQLLMKASPTEHEMALLRAIIEQTIRAIEPDYSRKNFDKDEPEQSDD
jgi:tRNA/rRNA methyltransferase